MTGIDRQRAEQLRDALRDASIKCSERCLYTAAKWAAELSLSLTSHFEDSGSETDIDSPMEGAEATPVQSTVLSGSTDPFEARLEAREMHKYLLARSYFDCKEFERCAAVFLPPGAARAPMAGATSAKVRSSPGHTKSKGPKDSLPAHDALPRLSQKSLFLALYAKYMAGEKKKDEGAEMIMGPQDKASVENKELASVSGLLERYFSQRGPKKSGDGWLEYLYGVVLAKGKNEDEAKKQLIQSIHLCPFNWSAWLELNDLIKNVEDLHKISPSLPRNIMTYIFSLNANQMLYQIDENVYRVLTDLESIFPTSLFIQTQKALLNYHAKDFDEAEAIFSSILQQDPYRLDSLDHYSNILYVMRARPKLAFLAQVASSTDKFRPETCCVIGNYYSLKSEHEKAVTYFRRALLLDRTFLSAWTLMGHEYVEMKNTHAAIEAYRRAVDVNRKDYRAWYGLGQTYEILEMHLYALFYYQRAASLRSHDATMWSAVGSCYDKVGRPGPAIKAYQRALVAGTYYDAAAAAHSFGSGGAQSGASAAPDAYAVAETLFNIALLHEKLGNVGEAASYMEMTLAQEEGQAAEDDEEEEEEGGDEDERRGAGVGVTATTSKARMWLARWAYGKGELARAMELANELCQDGVEVEEAKALIRDVRARMEMTLMERSLS